MPPRAKHKLGRVVFLSGEAPVAKKARGSKVNAGAGSNSKKGNRKSACPTEPAAVSVTQLLGQVPSEVSAPQSAEVAAVDAGSGQVADGLSQPVAATVAPVAAAQTFAPVAAAATVAPVAAPPTYSNRTLTRHASEASGTSETYAAGGQMECKSHDDVQNWGDTIVDFEANMTTTRKDGTSTCAADLIDEASERLTWSGAFSGVETYAAADLRMAVAFSRRCGRRSHRGLRHAKLRHAKHLWCVEWDGAARSELMVHPALGDCCIFGDVLTFVKPEYDGVIKHVQKFPHLHHVLKDVVTSGRLVGKRPSAYCFRHCKVCEAKATFGHRAGTPCTDFSKQGSQLGLNGPTVVYLMVWFAIMNSLQPTVIGQENVSMFPAEILGEYLPDWHLQWATEDSPNFGFPVSRIRQLCGLTHKQRTMPPSSIVKLSSWFREFHRSRSPACTHEIFFEATDDDVSDMFNDMVAKKKKVKDALFDPATFDFTRLLAPGHCKALKSYRKLSANQAYSLGQEPDSGHGCMSTNGLLPTIIKNCRPLWLEFASNPRPATGRELLHTQGIALPERMKVSICNGHPCSSFDVENPQRSEGSQSAQAGNGMNIMIAAVLTQFLVLSSELYNFHYGQVKAEGEPL